MTYHTSDGSETLSFTLYELVDGSVAFPLPWRKTVTIPCRPLNLEVNGQICACATANEMPLARILDHTIQEWQVKLLK